MEEKLVSVIIACYNAGKYIDACIESIIHQTYQKFEIIVCDDASSDNSTKLLAKWADKDNRIKILCNERNMYAAYTRNRCIEGSHGEYILIQDADDFSREDRIEILLNNFECENVDFISSTIVLFNDDLSYINVFPYQYYVLPKKIYPKSKDFLWNLPFAHPATMFKRKCIVNIGGYRVSEETQRGQDYDMFMRLYAEGYHGKNILDPVYYYRVDDANIKRRSWNARRCEMVIRYKGFKALRLLPWGFPFIFKPIVAQLFQILRYSKIILINQSITKKIFHKDGL